MALRVRVSASGSSFGGNPHRGETGGQPGSAGNTSADNALLDERPDTELMFVTEMSPHMEESARAASPSPGLRNPRSAVR